MSRPMVPVLAPVRSGAAAAAAVVLPSDVAGLTGWWKGDAGTKQTAGGTAASADGDPVGSWEDQSGGGRHWGQTTAAARPTLKTGGNGINGRSVLRFDNVDDLMTIATAAIGDFITAAAYTLFVVLRVAGADSGAATSYSNDGVVAEMLGYHGLFVKNTPVFQAYNWDGTEDHADVALVTATAYGVQQRHDSGTLYLLRSGTAEQSAASGNTAVVTGVPTLGRSGLVSAFLDGDLGELIYYNVALSASDRSNLQAYLASRWGLTW